MMRLVDTDENLKEMDGKHFLKPFFSIFKKCIELKENRIYIRGEFTRKNCKTAVLLYCFQI